MQLAAAQIGMGQVRAGQVRVRQVCAVEVTVVQPGASQLGAHQAAAGQVGVGQVAIGHVQVGEIAKPQIRPFATASSQKLGMLIQDRVQFGLLENAAPVGGGESGSEIQRLEPIKKVELAGSLLRLITND